VQHNYIIIIFRGSLTVTPEASSLHKLLAKAIAKGKAN